VKRIFFAKRETIVFAPLPGLIALLVALAPVRDLLFCAKHLFVGAKIVFVQKIDLGTQRPRRRRRSQLNGAI